MPKSPAFIPLAALALLVAWAGFAAPAAALQEAAAPTGAESAPDEPSRRVVVEDARAELAAELEQVRAARTAAVEDVDTELVVGLDAEIDQLERLDRRLSDQLKATDRIDEIAAQRATFDAKVAAAAAGASPRDLAGLDSLRDEYAGKLIELELAATRLSSAGDAAARAGGGRQEMERGLRQAQDALEANSDPAQAPPLRRALRLAQLEARIAGATSDLRALEFTTAEDALALRTDQERWLSESLEEQEAGFVFSEADREPPLDRLVAREQSISRELRQAETDAAIRREAYMTAVRRDESGGQDPVAGAWLEAHAAGLERADVRVTTLTQRLERVDLDRQVWQRRFQVLSDETPRELLEDWGAEIDAGVNQLAAQKREATLARDEAQTRLTAIFDPGADDDTARQVGIARSARRDHLAAFVQDANQELADIERALKQRGRVLAEITARTRTVSLQSWLRSIGRGFSIVWNYHFYPVEDRWVTPGKIVSALVVFFAGFILARFATRLLGQRILSRFNLDQGAVSAFQKLAFYFFILVFLLAALKVIDIPLTAFTVLGGALAIGVGFGSQNLINNFISGLIILAERPIRVGDLIDVDGTYGVVEQVGMRSTRVLTSDNVHIIVPNSTFLQTNVVNWTLSDDIVRANVVVGVAYGSPTRDVDRLIRRAVDNHGRILEKPEPVILFSDFGNDSLVFSVYFWIRARTSMQRRRVESDVRFLIDNYFREAGITIAFPQRDVHLDASAPVPVRVVGDEEVDGEPGAGGETPRAAGKAARAG